MQPCLEHVALLVEGARLGATQVVPVVRLEGDLLQLDCTPGFVEGVAAGDVIRITNVETGAFQVVRRAGNIAIKVFHEQDINPVFEWAAPRLAKYGAWVDGKIARAGVFTIPFKDQFASIESVLNEACSLFPGTTWYYGNVYDGNDQPLNWWIDFPQTSSTEVRR